MVVRQPRTWKGLGPYQFDRLDCDALFFLGGVAVRSCWCSHMLLGCVRVNRVAICLLHGWPAGSGKQERSLDRMSEASACLGSSLRHSLARTQFCSGC